MAKLIRRRRIVRQRPRGRVVVVLTAVAAPAAAGDAIVVLIGS